MWKQLSALARGKTLETAQNVVDRNALTILRQQIRDAADAVSRARKEVAIATAQNEQEIRHHQKLVARIDDLEARTIAALNQDKTELAREGAEAICLLEAERDASTEAQRHFGTELSLLKQAVTEAESRLRELHRGQRLATAVDSAQRLRDSAPGSTLSTLSDAEKTLSLLRSRQVQHDIAARVLAEMDLSEQPSVLLERFAAAGCGASTKSRADQVLERLQHKPQALIV